MIERNERGRFAAKRTEPTNMRSARLTDSCWEKLGRIANHRGVTRADLIEQLVSEMADIPWLSSTAFEQSLYMSYKRLIQTPGVRELAWSTAIPFKRLWLEMDLAPEDFLQLIERCVHTDLELAAVRGNNWTVGDRRVGAVAFRKPAQLEIPF